MIKNLTAVPETGVQSLGGEDPLEKAVAIYSSTLAWKTPWAEKLGGLQSIGSKRDTPEQPTLHTSAHVLLLKMGILALVIHACI